MTLRLLRMPSVEAKLGCKKSKIYELVARGELAKPVKIDGASVWPEAEIDAFISKLMARREAA